MRANTKKRKKATVMLKATQEQEWWADQVVQVMLHGKRALDAAMLDVGRLVAETLMYMEREERSGPDYHPTSSGLMKWASQRGSIYVGDQKLCVEHPRLRGPEGEVVLRTYEQLKNRGGFSEELLSKVLRGMSSRKYEETVTEAGKAFGVTPSSVSRHLVEATAKQLKQFRERSLEEFPVFAMYLDTVHRGGQAFVVALGVDREGKKAPTGLLGRSDGEPRDLRGITGGARATRIEAFQAGNLGYRRRRRDHQGTQGPDTARNSFTSDVRCTRIATSNATCPNATASGHTTSSRPPWSRTATRTRRRCCRSSSAGFAASTSRRRIHSSKRSRKC